MARNCRRTTAGTRAAAGLLLLAALYPSSSFQLVSFSLPSASRLPAASSRALRNSAQQVLTGYSCFSEWLHENGVQISGKADVLSQGAEESGISSRGLFASCELGACEELARVPLELTLTKESTKEALGSGVVSDGMNDYCAIALQLIFEKYTEGSASPWHQYIQILPAMKEVGSSFTWSDGDIGLLKGSTLQNASIFLRKKIQDEFHVLQETVFAKQPQIFPPDTFTLNRYMWAYSILLSRSFRLTINGEKDLVALVPYIDFINHSPTSKAYIKGTTEGTDRFFVMRTDREYQPGEQIYDSYGPRSNSELVLLYGFCLDTNVHDCIEVSVLDQWETTSMASTKRRWLLARGLSAEEMGSFFLFKGRWPEEMMVLLRLLVLHPSDVDHQGTAESMLAAFDKLGLNRPFSARVEESVLLLLKSLCDKLLSRCPPSVQRDDERLIQHTEAFERLSRNQRSAVRVRYGETRILRANVRRINRLLPSIPRIFQLSDAKARQLFPGLAADAKPPDFDFFVRELDLKGSRLSQ